MMLMALDHVRDYFTNVRFDPTDLTQTYLELFLTRWVTHFCAPVFVALTGVSAYLAGQRRGSKGELAKFLLTRGLWLILLEVTVIRFGWMFNLDYSFMWLQVIWAIGVSMVVLAGLIYLPLPVIGAIGVVLMAGHNLLDGVGPQDFGSPGWLWRLLHVPGPIAIGQGTMLVLYPLVPWIGVMAAGYALGPVMRWPRERRLHLLTGLGVALTLGFLVVRGLDGYGDPSRWAVQQDSDLTVASFLNTTKYPPSLLFLMMTLGPALLLLALFEAVPQGLLKPLVVFGRVPLFFYVVHIYLIHALAVIAAFVQRGDASFLFGNPGVLSPPADWGFRLRYVYVWWLAVVLMLYPLCRWFAGVKLRHRSAWLSYL